MKKLLESRYSCRDFNDKNIIIEDLKEVLEAAQHTASSINGQQVSIVISTEKKELEQLSKLCFDQKQILNSAAFLTIVGDYNRAEELIQDRGNEFIFKDDVESLLTASVDAGLIAQSIEMLLLEKGIHNCYIGSIRANLEEISEVLNITGNAFPVLGMAIGYTDIKIDSKEDLKLRPRIDFNTFAHFNKYDESKVRTGAREYNMTIKKWWEQKELPDHRTYQDTINLYYTNDLVGFNLEKYKMQGFLSQYKKD